MNILLRRLYLGLRYLDFPGRIFQIWGFCPGDWKFFQIWGFLSPRLGIFIPGDFYPRDFRQIPGVGNFWGWSFSGDGDFFPGMRYPTKKPPLMKNCSQREICFFLVLIAHHSNSYPHNLCSHTFINYVTYG